HLRRDHRRTVRRRLHGHAGARVHTDRRHRAFDSAIRASGQGRRHAGEVSRAVAARVASCLPSAALTPMSWSASEHSSFLIGSGPPLTRRGVGKSFSAKTILSGVDLHVPAGQYLAIIGRSGSGKSTLLWLIVGLDEPSAGTMEVTGVSAGRARLTRIMFQEPRLLPWARVDANVAIGLGPAEDQAQALYRSREALATVGLVDRAGEWPSTLSGGQKQRVALVSAPRILAL